MDYVYWGRIEEVAGDWLCTVPSFPEAHGVFGGGMDKATACEVCAEALRLTIAEMLDGGEPLPKDEGEGDVLLVVEVSERYIAETKCVTQEEAAAELGVTKGRVGQLLDAGLLEVYDNGGARLVTIASVEARKASKPKRGRPRKEGR